MTQTITDPEVTTETTSVPGRFAHYVRKGRIVEAAIEGTPLEALCGYVWVPSRDPQSLPVCPPCKAVYDDHEAMTIIDPSSM